MTRTLFSKLAVAALLAAAAALAARPVYAHGFGERYDLPIPLGYFLAGAGAAVALSFIVVGMFLGPGGGGSRYPRYNLLAAPVLGRALSSQWLRHAVRAASLFLFAVVLSAALAGTGRPLENIAPTFVWIVWWVGMGYVAAVAGNLWALVNPWKTAFEWVQGLIGENGPDEDAALFDYPEDWGVWPALLLFVAFAWVENVYADASRPFNLGVLVLAYSAITWAGMLAFGKHRWLRHGEVFSVLFGIFARFSPTEARVSDSAVCGSCSSGCVGGECVDCYECFELADPGERELNVRPYAVGLTGIGRVSTSTMVFVVAALAMVTFDGIVETPRWVSFQTQLYGVAEALFGGNALKAIDTLGLLMVPALLLVLYLIFCLAMRSLAGERVPTSEVAGAFVFSLVPIALAYNIAHFLSLLLINGQLIIPLASDPFGAGWNVFGTAGYEPNTTIVGAKFVWFLSVAVIVAGHIASVYTAHVIALRRLSDSHAALRSQYPMLALMVGYTAISLWILAQPIVEG